jgi:hypothetical protein
MKREKKKKKKSTPTFIVRMNNITNALRIFSTKKNLFNSPGYVVG